MDRTNPTRDQQLSVLIRIGASLDIVGDVSVTVQNPSELIAWATVAREPKIVAWRSELSGKRFVTLIAIHAATPVHGRITATLEADHHPAFWKALIGGDLDAGAEHPVTGKQLGKAWDQVPLEIGD